ncbi:MAG: hypothetical protein JNK45_36895 [Myxococcales bacterium]|nr:hypothetical protein [Myxococcales bacterium]
MKQPTTVLLSCFASLLALTACDDRAPTTDSIEVSAAKLAEAQGLEDYSIEVIDPPSDPAAPPVAPEVDGLASEQPDPEEMRCYQWGDGSGCSTCIMSFFGCSYWASDCLDGAWSNC